MPTDTVEAEMAADYTNNFQPVDPKTVFARTDKWVYLVYQVIDAPANSSLEVTWVAVDVPGQVHNYAFMHDHCECQPVPGEGVVGAFALGSPPGGYLAGSYSVYLYLNGTLIGIYPFEIR